MRPRGDTDKLFLGRPEASSRAASIRKMGSWLLVMTLERPSIIGNWLKRIWDDRRWGSNWYCWWWCFRCAALDFRRDATLKEFMASFLLSESESSCTIFTENVHITPSYRRVTPKQVLDHIRSMQSYPNTSPESVSGVSTDLDRSCAMVQIWLV